MARIGRIADQLRATRALTLPASHAESLPADPRSAAEQLFARYAQRLYRLAEQHLSHKLAGRVDGEDVVQSVFRTFFRRQAAGEFRCDSSGQLWRLLVKITILKARAKARHHTASMRDVRLEAPATIEPWVAESVARDPGPDEAAALVDQIETLLDGLPPLYCRLLEMRLEGREVREIAGELEVSRQTVYRALKLLQGRLLRATDESSAK